MILRLVLALAAFSSVLARPAEAAYPDRPVTLVVPFAAGGPSDIIARIIAEHWSRTLGQQFIIENVTGAGGTVGVTRVMRAPAGRLHAAARQSRNPGGERRALPQSRL